MLTPCGGLIATTLGLLAMARRNKTTCDIVRSAARNWPRSSMRRKGMFDFLIGLVVGIILGAGIFAAIVGNWR